MLQIEVPDSLYWTVYVIEPFAFAGGCQDTVMLEEVEAVADNPVTESGAVELLPGTPRLTNVTVPPE